MSDLNQAVPNHLAGERQTRQRVVWWCIRRTRLTLVCEVIRYRLVQVRHNLKECEIVLVVEYIHQSCLEKFAFAFCHEEFTSCHQELACHEEISCGHSGRMEEPLSPSQLKKLRRRARNAQFYTKCTSACYIVCGQCS